VICACAWNIAFDRHESVINQFTWPTLQNSLSTPAGHRKKTFER